EQNNLYFALYDKAVSILNIADYDDSRKLLEGRAKEDARYVLALATETQMGMTINARNLERLLRRLDSLPLAEAAELKQQLEARARKIAPSLVRFTEAGKYEREVYSVEMESQPVRNSKSVSLVEFCENPDERILTALLYSRSDCSYRQVREIVANMNSSELAEIFEQVFKNLCSYHSLPRAFEVASFTFELSMSSSCFAQVKRHRMASIFFGRRASEYVVPPLLLKLNMDDAISEVIRHSNLLSVALDKHLPGLGDYILTNAHRVTLLFKANLRELYHFSRLRSDEHAQWEIRELSEQMDLLLLEKAPLAAAKLMGKHEFQREKDTFTN
ncbi:MAG: FAD-dependent thymidylate synthase, partial [Candidatus Cloacimonetes bacterium]|nr:FAD-dependent thymidylate synthase [Candidatus Cloacimonadota bacterium]